MLKFSSSVKRKDRASKKQESRGFDQTATFQADQIQQLRRTISMDNKIFEEYNSEEPTTVIRRKAAPQRYSVVGSVDTPQTNASLLFKAFLNGGKL